MLLIGCCSVILHNASFKANLYYFQGLLVVHLKRLGSRSLRLQAQLGQATNIARLGNLIALLLSQYTSTGVEWTC